MTLHGVLGRIEKKIEKKVTDGMFPEVNSSFSALFGGVFLHLVYGQKDPLRPPSGRHIPKMLLIPLGDSGCTQIPKDHSRGVQYGF